MMTHAATQIRNIVNEPAFNGNRPVLYMMGCGNLTRQQLVILLQKYNINCMVDVRGHGETGGLTPDVLRQTLREKGGYFLPFAEEFGNLPVTKLVGSNSADDQKAVLSEAFQRGIARLEQGLARGFHITLTDEVTIPSDSYRLSLLAQYLRGQNIEVQSISLDAQLLRHTASGKGMQGSTTTPSHNALGQWGENIAAEYLCSKGYKIVERNWRYRHREIDIIAYDMTTGTLCFVEVKTRRNNRFGDPEFAVNRKKMWFLVVAAGHYIRSRRIDTNARFDIIAITGTPHSGYQLSHIPDAIPPSVRTTYR